MAFAAIARRGVGGHVRPGPLTRVARRLTPADGRRRASVVGAVAQELFDLFDQRVGVERLGEVAVVDIVVVVVIGRVELGGCRRRPAARDGGRTRPCRRRRRSATETRASYSAAAPASRLSGAGVPIIEQAARRAPSPPSVTGSATRSRAPPPRARPWAGRGGAAHPAAHRRSRSGPSYWDRWSSKRSIIVSSVAVPISGTGREWGTSASSAPSESAMLTSNRSAIPRSCSVKSRQRSAGSGPSTSITSVPGSEADQTPDGGPDDRTVVVLVEAHLGAHGGEIGEHVGSISASGVGAPRLDHRAQRGGGGVAGVVPPGERGDQHRARQRAARRASERARSPRRSTLPLDCVVASVHRERASASDPELRSDESDAVDVVAADDRRRRTRRGVRPPDPATVVVVAAADPRRAGRASSTTRPPCCSWPGSTGRSSAA